MRTVMHVQVKVPSIRSWGGSAVCTAVPAYSCWLFPLVFGSCLLTTDSFLIICKAEQSTGDPQGKGLGGKRRISTVDQTEQRRFSSLSFSFKVMRDFSFSALQDQLLRLQQMEMPSPVPQASL